MDNIDINMDESYIHLTKGIDNLDKESSMRIMRKLMTKLLETDTDDTFKDLFDSVTKALDNYESIDKDMVSKLTSIFQDSLQKKDAFDMAKAIDEGSTIVYFKSAQLFKVYKKEDSFEINEQ